MEAGTPADRTIVGRMMRAARLEEAVYEEVEHDHGATRQAAIVVVGTSIAGGIGAGIAVGIDGLIFLTIAGLIGWAAYAWVTYFIGTRLLAGPETSADWGELAGTLGFANSPRALLVIGVVPALAGIVGLVVGLGYCGRLSSRSGPRSTSARRAQSRPRSWVGSSRD
jgi:hypothetical protein